MKESLKKNWALVTAFTLPVVLIIIVALSTYLPSLFLSTNYNFIYSVCTDGTNYYSYDYCNNYFKKLYTVVDGKLVVNNYIDPNQDSDKDGVPDVKENYTNRIFLHDTLNNESREITLEEAQKLNLNKLLTSPDGVTISNNYDNGADYFLFFDTGSNYGYYLVKGNKRDKLNLINSSDRYYYRYNNNFQFIGWVLPGRS
ncbi:MAG: hypothetical protein R3B60_02670 [Candidatus Paceibacterota bacterium]